MLLTKYSPHPEFPKNSFRQVFLYCMGMEFSRFLEVLYMQAVPEQRLQKSDWDVTMMMKLKDKKELNICEGVTML